TAIRLGVLGILVIGCVFLNNLSGRILEYGTGGWLWALMGLSLRFAQEGLSPDRRWMPAALAIVAVGAYVGRESRDLEMSAVQPIIVAGMIAVLAASLLAFRRIPLPMQPPAPIALLCRFCGTYSLEIYAIHLFAMQLAGHMLGTDEGSDDDDDDDDDD